MFERKSMKWPIILAVTMIVLLVSLMVGWVLLNVFGWQRGELPSRLYWFLISAGSAMFTCVVVGVVLYLILSIQQINLTRRQSNFIDAVTHELKSPIASIKLTLQTLNRRSIDEQQRHDFYGSMLKDVDRLDLLISQLLDVARLSHRDKDKLQTSSEVRVDLLINKIIEEVSERYRSPRSDQYATAPDIQLRVSLEPIVLNCEAVGLELLFRNVIDNAFKYAGKPPEVGIEIAFDPKNSSLRATISDNGPGIPRSMRRRIFNRFFRIGDELERKKPGTGLGLFLVRTVIRRLRGKIFITDGPQHHGTHFVIVVPGAMRSKN